jgi:hypothetical protein
MIMRLGNSICLIAFGAALTFAVNLPSDRINIHIIGVIVMVVGLLSLFLSPSDWNRPGSWATALGIGEPRSALVEEKPVVQETPVVAEAPLAPDAPVYSSLRVVEMPPADSRRHVS